MSERSLFGNSPAHAAPEPALPPINGTPNQIPWAEQVRAGKLAHCRKALTELQRLTEQYRRSQHEAYERHRARLRAWMDSMERLEAETSARFWLDHRENLASELLNGEEAKPGPSW